MLANGAMVTTDVGAAFCFVAAMYSFYRYCRKPGWVRLGVAGVALGVALSAKYTGIFLVPMLGLVVVLEGWSGSGLERALAEGWSAGGDGVDGVGGGVGILWVPV